MQKLVIGSLVAIVVFSTAIIVFLNGELNDRSGQVNTLSNLVSAIPENPAVDESVLHADATTDVVDASEEKSVEKVRISSIVKQEAKKAPETPKPVELLKAPEPVVKAPDGPFKFDQTWKDAFVYLYCSIPYQNSTKKILFANGSEFGKEAVSGNGVVIDPRGIILTNAHIGWNFLFADWPNQHLLDCFVRVGSSANPTYHATLLYLPTAWLDKNIELIGNNYISYEEKKQEKKDYALLYIEKPTDLKVKLPALFSYLPINIDSIPVQGSYIYEVGYPGSILGDILLTPNPSLSVSAAVVDSVSSITGNVTNDTLLLKGNTPGQYGTSGGAVISAGGKLAALSTSFGGKGQGESPANATIKAITIDYINRDIKADTGFSIAEFAARDTPKAISENFLNNIATDYRIKYVKAWQKKLNVLIPGVDYTAIGQECVLNCSLQDTNPSLWE